MKNLYKYLLICLTIFFLNSCLLPGYINKDGSITPPYSSEIKIEVISGTITVQSDGSDIGIQSIRATNTSLPYPERTNQFNMYAPESFSFDLKGNNNVVLTILTTDSEAKFKITYKSRTTEYIIHNNDILGKSIYFENY